MDTMPRLGDLMHKEPNATQAETVHHVLDVALGWQAGQLDLDGVRSLCSGFDRWQAIRFADPKHEGYPVLLALLETLVAADRGVLRTGHGIVIRDELYEQSVKKMTNWEERRVLVWPLLWMDSEPYYSPVHLPPGEERREIETALLLRYNAYRDAKRKRPRGDH